MLRMFRRDESGYSIVEVMVAILILMAAILPMFKMFDVSLQTAMRSSDYDRARALAEKQTEIAQSIGFEKLEDDSENGFPRMSAEFDLDDCVLISDPEIPKVKIFKNCQDKTSDTFGDLRFKVEKSYVEPTGEETITLADTEPETNLIKIVITVYKSSSNPDNFIFNTVGVIPNDD